jgi:hypothetical protein
MSFMAEVMLSRAQNKILLWPKTLCATTFFTRTKGLLAHKNLSADEALFIRPCNSVHTLGMAFSIDVVFLDKQQRVLKIIHDLKPYRMAICRKADAVLEVAANSVARYELKTGDQLSIDV